MSRAPRDDPRAPQLPGRSRSPGTGSQPPFPSAFVPAPPASEKRSGRWKWYVLGFLALAAVGAVGLMVAWPSLHPRKLDPVERVAESYLKALASEEPESARRFGIVEEPPAIRSLGSFRRDRGHDKTIKGSFAPLGKLNARIESEYNYDAASNRFTPKNAMGAAAETLDALHKAKDDAEKSGLYKKMESGDPNDLFDAAEQYGKVFTNLAEGVLAPKKILPTYRMLIDEAKPPLPKDAQSLALEAADALPTWNALLKRRFETLKADGPFIYERARVNATATDRLASLGDPPSRIRLELARFRLEGIDTGWKVIGARRILPGDVENEAKPKESSEASEPKARQVSPGESTRSPGDVSEGR